MKKDKVIEKKLNEYADSIKLPCNIIYDAINVMKNAKTRPVMRTFSMQRFFKAAALLSVAAVVLIFALNIFNIIGNTGKIEIVKYNMEDLGKKNIAFSAISQINENILFLDMENMSTSCNLFFDRTTKKTVMVSVKYNIISDSGNDEVFLIADIKNGLKEYEHFKSFRLFESEGISVYAKTYYENGEYYTNAFFSKDGIDYYIIMMSPSQGQDKFYLQKLLLF